jgi:hypothetical protein
VRERIKMAPSKQFYLNDIMIQISCGWSFAHVIFWIFYAWEYSYHGIGAALLEGVKLETEGMAWFVNALASAKVVAVPVTFFLLAILFYLLGSLLDYQQYNMDGTTFYFGLTDTGDVNRQWYYALGMALLCFQTVIFIIGLRYTKAIRKFIKATAGKQ